MLLYLIEVSVHCKVYLIKVIYTKINEWARIIVACMHGAVYIELPYDVDG